MSKEPILIVGNWKMNGNAALAASLVDSVAAQTARAPEHVKVALCPPFTLLSEVARRMIGSKLHLGGQDCHPEKEGAFTGDTSAQMLKDAGCAYVIVGHSERRAGHGETSAWVHRKAEAALAAGLSPIICVGESKAEREAGQAEQVVEKQLKESLPTGHFHIAYEPVWAIGTGLAATPDDIAAMHAHIRKLTGQPALYGGSVKAANALEILTIPNVSGLLVGGASLKAEEFCKIIESA